jgi:hypothetical protein
VKGSLVLLAGLAIGLGAVADADAGRRRAKKRPNMPANWAWPPSAPMRSLGRECLQELTELGVEWKRAPRTRAVATPVVIESLQLRDVTLGSIFRKPPFIIDCHLALALARVAPALHASGIAELRFSTIHDFRRVRLNGGTRRALSRHALGLAIDVYELVTRDGEIIIILEHYAGSSHARAAEALLIRSGLFRAVLTPGNDPRSHYDHFHLEAQMEIPDPPAPRRRRHKKKRRGKKKRRR